MTPAAIARQWFAAYEAMDLDRLLALYHDECVLHWGDRKAKGKDAVFNGYETEFGPYIDGPDPNPDHPLTLLNVIAQDNICFIAWLTSPAYDRQGRFDGRLFEFKDGRIISERLYSGGYDASEFFDEIHYSSVTPVWPPPEDR